MKRWWYLIGGCVGAGFGYLVFVLGICASGNLLTKDPGKSHPGIAVLLLAAASMSLFVWFRREYVD